MTNKKLLISLLLILFLIGWGIFLRLSLPTSKSSITNFIECRNAGYPIMESYPAQCRDGSGHNFVEDIADNPVVIPAPGTAKFNKTISLNLQDKVTFSDGLSVALKEINDSRCKPDVRCIWAGELSATFAISRGSDLQQEIILGTTTAPRTTVEWYTFSLQNITEKTVTITVSNNGSYVPPSPTEKSTKEIPKLTNTFKTRCESAGGTWSDRYNGCLGVEGADCENIEGKFDSCAANCASTPDGEVCTNGCLRICRT